MCCGLETPFDRPKFWTKLATDAPRGSYVQAAIDDAPIPMPFLLDEPTALTDEWSVTSLVRNVGRVLREGSGAPDPEPDEEKDLATAQEELPRENLEQAEVHAEAGKLDQAIAIYERWVELKPDDMKVVRPLLRKLIREFFKDG